MTKFKPIGGREQATQILLGLFITFIFAGVFAFFAPWIFTWITGFFDTTPDALRDCKYSEYKNKTLRELTACWDKSDSYEAQVRRLRHKIPWFWIAFIFFGWMFLKNPILGRMRDDSDDIVYEGEGIWVFLLNVLFHILIIVLAWAFLARDIPAFIGIALVVAAIIFWHLLDRFFRKKYGKPKSERAK